jgi:FHA domain
VELHTRADDGAHKVAELQEAMQLRQAEHTTQIAQLRGEQAAQIARLQSEAETHEQEMAVLMAHLQEARRPIQSIEADVKRLTEELAAKSAAFHEFEQENGKLRASLERTRGALEEREFLIRRLERSESNNANVLGRIQTSIERLGSVPVAPSAAAAPAADWSAELIRIDGERPVTHVLSRRTRIGRAAGCELQIDSGSVSRHHALVVVGPREAVIEDLNSTNGVLVNGRKVTRQLLCDGDAVTIGEIQFRYFARPLHSAPDPSPVEPTP